MDQKSELEKVREFSSVSKLCFDRFDSCCGSEKKRAHDIYSDSFFHELLHKRDELEFDLDVSNYGTSPLFETPHILDEFESIQNKEYVRCSRLDVFDEINDDGIQDLNIPEAYLYPNYPYKICSKAGPGVLYIW